MKTAIGQGEKGFSLIEIIAVMVLMGFLGAFASMGVAQFTKGFLFATENAAIAGKGEVAMLRILKEFVVISAVTTGNATSITYTNPRAGSPHTVSLVGADLTLDGDVLADKVSAFSLSYYPSYSGTATATWQASTTLIEFSLTLSGTQGNTSTFTSRVAPRN